MSEWTFVDKGYNDGQTDITMSRPGGTGDELVLLWWGHYNAGTGDASPDDADWTSEWDLDPTAGDRKAVLIATNADIDDLTMSNGDGNRFMVPLGRDDWGDTTTIEVDTNSTGSGTVHNPADVTVGLSDYTMVGIFKHGGSQAGMSWSGGPGWTEIGLSSDGNQAMGAAYADNVTDATFDPGTITLDDSAGTPDWWWIAIPSGAGGGGAVSAPLWMHV